MTINDLYERIVSYDINLSLTSRELALDFITFCREGNIVAYHSADEQQFNVNTENEKMVAVLYVPMIKTGRNVFVVIFPHLVGITKDMSDEDVAIYPFFGYSKELTDINNGREIVATIE